MYGRRIDYYEGQAPSPIGGLSPVPATPEMTKPVGVKDGELFTEPSGLPVVTAADHYGMLVVDEDGLWQVEQTPHTTMAVHTQLIQQLIDRMTIAETRINNIVSDLVQVEDELAMIVAGNVSEVL